MVKLTIPQADSDPLEATFELNDTLYAKAHIPPTEEVYLWLGVSQPNFAICVSSLTRIKANVMLSYPLSEAEELLESRLNAAQTSLATCEEDLDFLREQITVNSISPSF